MAMLVMNECLAASGYKNKATWYAQIREGLVPKPVKLSTRAVAWPADEVRLVIDARIAGMDKGSIKKLVQNLHAKREEKLAELLALAA